MEEIYVEMAAAIKRRDHAVTMLKRWTTVLQGAEAEIQKLSGALAELNKSADTVFDQLVAESQSFEQA
jgi:pyruvate/2-oxoglutarate dehydrogenase complex dihydrolipoamide dehydrogenase (E3) component